MFPFFKRLGRDQKRLLYACFFAFFCNGLVSLTLGSAMPDLKASYGISDTVGGMLLSGHSAGNLAAGFLSGLAPFWLGRKRSVVLLSLTAFLGMLLIALTGVPAALFIAFVLTGIGRGSVTNFDNRTVNELTDGDAAAANLLHAVFAIGAITAPMAFLVLKRSIDWRAGLLLVTACGAASCFSLSRQRIPEDAPGREGGKNASLAFLAEPAFLVMAGMMLCYICSEYAINGWLVTYIQQKETLRAAFPDAGAVAAYSQSMATLLWTVIFAGRLTCAALSRRVAPCKLMLIASAGEALCFFGMLRADTAAMVTLCVAGTGFCMAGICPMIYSDAVYYTNRYPLATGALLAVGAAGGIAMPTIVGVLADRHGFAGGMSAILAAICLLVIFAAAHFAIVRRGDRRAG